MRAKAEGAWKRAAWALLALAVLLVFPALMQGADPQNGDFVLAEEPEGGCSILLFAEWMGKDVLAYSGPEQAAVLAVDPASGTEEHRADFSCPLYWAAPRGGSLFVLEASGDSLVLESFSQSLEPVSREEFPLKPGNLLFFDCSPEGALYAVETRGKETLLLLEPEGERQERRFDGDVEFLGVTPQGGLFVHAAGKLYSAEDGALESLKPLTCTAAPAVLLGEDLLLDRDGMVCRMEEGWAKPLFRCLPPVYSQVFPCLDRRNCLILSNGESGLLRYSLDGKPLGSRTVEGTLLGISPSGALVRRERLLTYAPHGFREEPSPSPTVPPQPSETPGLSPDPGLSVDGIFLSMPAGSTVQELLTLFQPDFVTVRDASGKAVSAGRLATGMTAGAYTLVVPGDCTGNGAVNGGDIRAAHAHVLGTEPLPGEAYRRAADLDGDGAVTGADLVLLGAVALL